MQKQSQRRQKRSFVGGLTLWHVDKPGMRAARFTRPLGKLEMGDDSFVLTPRGPLKLALRPTAVRYSEISEIISWPSRLASVIEFRSTRPDIDGAFFVTISSNFGDLVDAFRRHGVTLPERAL
jgi:hypothetical protein